ncbi:MAG: hypothetical protein AAF228_04115 [Pseudomonadota bacterium]
MGKAVSLITGYSLTHPFDLLLRCRTVENTLRIQNTLSPIGCLSVGPDGSNLKKNAPVPENSFWSMV